MAENSRIAFSFRKQTAFGVKATGQYNYFNFDSEELAYDRGKERKKTILPTGERAGLISKAESVEGAIETILQFNNTDAFIASLLRSSWSDVIGGTGGGIITAGLQSSNLEFSFIAEEIPGEGGIIELGSNVSHSILKDQIIFVNTVDEENTGSFIVLNVIGNAIYVNTPLITAMYQTGATIKGDIIRNGNLIDYYTFERFYSDINEYITYLSCVVSEGEFTFEPENEVFFNFSLMGQTSEVNSSSSSTGTPIAVVTTPEFSVGENVEGVYFDNELMSNCLIGNLDFKVNNDTEGRRSIAVFGPCNMRNKAIDVTGNITIWFPDLTEYTKFVQDTKFKIDYIIGDSLNNRYSFTFPQVEYKTAAVNFTDLEEEIPEEHEMVMSSNGIYTIQICKKSA